jgi:hypothetical protein
MLGILTSHIMPPSRAPAVAEKHPPKVFLSSLSFCVCLYFSVLCKLCARGVVRVGVSLNLVTRSGVHGEGPTLMMSTPAWQQIGLENLTRDRFSA